MRGFIRSQPTRDEGISLLSFPPFIDPTLGETHWDDDMIIMTRVAFFYPFGVQLEAMGFDRSTVLEAYFACNKNEELTANYLVDHMHDFED